MHKASVRFREPPMKLDASTSTCCRNLDRKASRVAVRFAARLIGVLFARSDRVWRRR
jgi:hypothetical protein